MFPAAFSNRSQLGCSAGGQDESTDRPIPDPPEDVLFVSSLVRELIERQALLFGQVAGYVRGRGSKSWDSFREGDNVVTRQYGDAKFADIADTVKDFDFAFDEHSSWLASKA
jgi:hypothetical protein